MQKLLMIPRIVFGLVALTLAACQSDSQEDAPYNSEQRSPVTQSPASAADASAQQNTREIAVDLNNRASALFGSNPDSALTLLNRAINTDTEFEQSYINKTTLLMQMQQYDEALATLARSKELDPGLAELYTVEGLIYENMQQPESARKSYAQAVYQYQKPRYDTLAFGRDSNLALLLTITDSPQAALAAYDKLLKDPSVDLAMHPVLKSYRNAVAVYQGGGLLEFFEPGPVTEYCVAVSAAAAQAGEQQRKLQQELLEAGINARGSSRSQQTGDIIIRIENRFRAKALAFGLKECK